MNLLQPVSNNKALTDLSLLFARIGLSLIFILAGMNKIQQYEGTAQYMDAMGVPGALLPLVIALEVGGGVLLLIGGFTQLIALALAGFSLATALIFHFDLGNQAEFINFFKNIALAGGFLAVAASGAGKYSLDTKLITD